MVELNVKYEREITRAFLKEWTYQKYGGKRTFTLYLPIILGVLALSVLLLGIMSIILGNNALMYLSIAAVIACVGAAFVFPFTIRRAANKLVKEQEHSTTETVLRLFDDKILVSIRNKGETSGQYGKLSRDAITATFIYPKFAILVLDDEPLLLDYNGITEGSQTELVQILAKYKQQKD
ncbi:MAG: hypothetical protein LBN42_02315 [Oscillospiraceae bacterium]|jgi:hypothetical protein|nr:hypothetical protein [Oscillospiraceae bacterium]